MCSTIGGSAYHCLRCSSIRVVAKREQWVLLTELDLQECKNCYAINHEPPPRAKRRAALGPQSLEALFAPYSIFLEARIVSASPPHHLRRYAGCDYSAVGRTRHSWMLHAGIPARHEHAGGTRHRSRMSHAVGLPANGDSSTPVNSVGSNCHRQASTAARQREPDAVGPDEPVSLPSAHQVGRADLASPCPGHGLQCSVGGGGQRTAWRGPVCGNAGGKDRCSRRSASGGPLPGRRRTVRETWTARIRASSVTP
jgi:hypothetical protein